MEEPINKRMKLTLDLENNPPEDTKTGEDSLADSEDILSEAKIAAEESKINLQDDGSMFPFPKDEDSSEMLEGVDFTNKWPCVTDRYFTPFYKIDVQTPEDDICIRIHTNRICMISLAPSHSILQENKQVSNVNFRVSEKLDRTKNKVKGKGKHGAQPMQENSNICAITCTDGKTHMIKCCMIGKLVEVNESLATNPSLLKEPPHKGGYLAIVLPNIKLVDDMRMKLLTQEGYEAAIEQRKAKFKVPERKEEPVL
ncbi:protein Abitram [Belonocnema kinseyi]|uniref:protein Abitram n=1 Tax=Belonocnema kinseyi TaxID=2817044 RepID=UPI00143DE60A|nr:protein Abitram [Belonocnema kinseyi]